MIQMNYFTITLSFTPGKYYSKILICNAMYCNAEGHVKVIRYYYDDIDSGPFAKDIMRYCEIHAKKIVGGDTVVKTVVLS